MTRTKETATILGYVILIAGATTAWTVFWWWIVGSTWALLPALGIPPVIALLAAFAQDIAAGRP